MTATEAAKRNEKSQWLKVWQMDPTNFYVESEDGKIAYRTNVTDDGFSCTCGDFMSRSKNDPEFRCKHILAVMNSIPRDEVMEAQLLDRRKPKLDERFIKTIDGKDFCIYAGLLDLAHQKNLMSMDVELIQFPSEENKYTAVCRAIAKTASGGMFQDIGDSNPTNCNSKVVKHLIRMASTRAKARCLRDLTNIGMTALEELGDISEVLTDEDPQRKAPQARKDNVKKFPARKSKESQEESTGSESSQGTANEEVKPEKAEESTQSHDTQSNLTSPIKPDGLDKQPRPRQTTKNSNGKGNGKSKPDQVPLMSEAQRSAIYNLSRRRNISVEELDNLAMKTFNSPLENLTSSDASLFIRTLQQAS